MAQENTTAKRPDRMEAIGSWILLVAILCENLGVVWDVQWHDDVGPDTFFTASHLLIYLAPVIAGLTSLYIVLRRTADRRRGTEDSERAAAAVTVLGTFRAPVGFLVAGIGSAIELLYGLGDLWWHSIYGFDVTLNSPPHVGLALGGVGICVGTILAFAGLREHRWGRWGLVMSVAISMATVIFALFWAQPRSVTITLVDVLALVLVAGVVRRPGWVTLTGLCFGVLHVVDWYFGPWAAEVYAGSVGLPLRDGVSGLPRMAIMYPMLLPVAAVLLDVALTLGRKGKLSPKVVMPAAGAVAGVVLLLSYLMQDHLFDMTRRPGLLAGAIGVLLAALAAWLGWWFAHPLRNLCPRAEVN
jgi:hypothetical protein